MPEFKIKSTIFFTQQLEELDEKAQDILAKKFRLLKVNPFRYKKLYHTKRLVFRIRFKSLNKEKRLIYTVQEDTIVLMFILDRENDYKDMDAYIRKCGID